MGFLLGLFVDLEDEGNTFLRTDDSLSTDYTVLYHRRYKAYTVCGSGRIYPYFLDFGTNWR
jgi:hypothetical protein